MCFSSIPSVAVILSRDRPLLSPHLGPFSEACEVPVLWISVSSLN